MWIGAGVAVVVVVVAAILVVSLTGSSPKKATAAATPAASGAPSTPPSTPATAAASGPAFPGVPAGEAAGLKTKPVVKAGTGTVTKLVVKNLIKGTGAVVKSGDSIVVNYLGVTYKDGKEFDASWDHSQTYPVVIGTGQVIPGWDQGLVGVTVGSRVQLDIPSSLAYGDSNASGPSGALRFVVDVLSAQPAS
jgi:peptidylprolyl isomerase